MVTLKKAMKLAMIDVDDVIFIKYYGESDSEYQFHTGCDVRNKFDMQETKVKHIVPLFNYNEYRGMAFILER